MGVQQLPQGQAGLVRLLIRLGHQLVAQQLTERLRHQVPLQHSADGHGDGACLLRYDDHHCVGVFAHADARTVTHTQIAAEVHILRQRQHASGA